MNQETLSHQLKQRLAWLVRSMWLFPTVLVIFLLFMTIFRVSGTSVGQYHSFLYGEKAKDPALITGEPRKIRSDEWGVNTPLTVSQTKEGLPVLSEATGHGQDVAITFDIPYKDWSTLFKPQNWAFFVLPVEYAFAFKWWLLAVLLMLACYAFVLVALPRKYLIASLLSISLFFSPFMQWWYQSGSLLSFALALFIATLAIHLSKPHPGKRATPFLLAGLTYATTCFAFIAYVPFIVPLALTFSAFLLGQIINTARLAKDRKQYLQRLALFAAAPILVSSILFASFLHAHNTVLSALGSSTYPGDRTEPSGGYSLLQLLGGYYNLQLQNDTAALHASTNQSEASNFVLVGFFLTPIFLYFFVQHKKLKIPVDWRVVLLLGLTCFFLARLFIPQSEFFFNLTQLNRIPHNRLLIGLGFINLLLTVISIQQLNTIKVAIPARLRQATVLLSFLVVGLTGIGLRSSLSGYLENLWLILFVSILISIIVWLFLKRRLAPAIGFLVCLSLLSAAQVNPLYRGLGILTHSKLSDTLSSFSDHPGKWVVGDYAASFESLPAASGLQSLSGVYAYPQLNVWKGIGSDDATRNVYNRYAHVFFSVEPLTQAPQNQGTYFDPPALDAFRVHTDPCSEFLQNQHVGYVLQTQTLQGDCVQKVSDITYPKLTFHIYKIIR
jgi:hypothetical protein